jgi:hypothetical protein
MNFPSIRRQAGNALVFVAALLAAGPIGGIIGSCLALPAFQDEFTGFAVAAAIQLFFIVAVGVLAARRIWFRNPSKA